MPGHQNSGAPYLPDCQSESTADPESFQRKLQGAAMERIEYLLETFLMKLAPNVSQTGHMVNGQGSNGHVANGRNLNGQASNGLAANGHHIGAAGAIEGLQIHRRPQAYSPVPPARHKQHQS